MDRLPRHSGFGNLLGAAIMGNGTKGNMRDESSFPHAWISWQHQPCDRRSDERRYDFFYAQFHHDIRVVVQSFLQVFPPNFTGPIIPLNTLILATRNAGKVREISEILHPLNVWIRSLLDFPNLPEIIEDGTTFEENALKKARTAFTHTHFPTLADDSGIEVFYLNGKPGVYSARYAGNNVTYDDNNKKLLDALKGIPFEQRKAQFRCVVVFVARGIEKIAEGISPGRIVEYPRGMGGFGYDPVFIPEGSDQTFAELHPEIKNRISHRGKALQAIRDVLTEYFSNRS